MSQTLKFRRRAYTRDLTAPREIGAPISHGPSPSRETTRSGEAGVALILVMFVVALATIIVVELAYSSYIGGRLNRGAQRSLQAEYLLRSTLSLAQILLKTDSSNEDRLFPEDAWAYFRDGAAVPLEFLGVSEPNLSLALEIRPEDAKLRLQLLDPISLDGRRYAEILLRLFQHPTLDFDNDGQLDESGRVTTKEFGAAEMIANLLDFMDADTTSYDEGPFQGVEGQLEQGDEFPNRRISRVEELSSIPGFTPLRVQKLLPFVTTQGSHARVNVNLAPRELLESIDPNVSSGDVEAIVEFRGDPNRGPVTQVNQDLSALIGSQDDFFNRLTVGEERRVFQVIAKADYQTSVYFLRAYVERDRVGPGSSLRVLSMEFF